MLKDKNISYEKILLKINNFIFKVFFISYLIFLSIDNFKEEFISNFFNLNNFLIIFIVSGIISVTLDKNKALLSNNKPTKKDFLIIIILSILGSIFIFIKIKEIGWLSYAIAIFSGIIIYSVSILLLDIKKYSKN